MNDIFVLQCIKMIEFIKACKCTLMICFLWGCRQAMLPGETLWPNVCVGAIDLNQQSNSVRLNPLPFAPAPSLCQYDLRGRLTRCLKPVTCLPARCNRWLFSYNSTVLEPLVLPHVCWCHQIFYTKITQSLWPTQTSVDRFLLVTFGQAGFLDQLDQTAFLLH